VEVVQTGENVCFTIAESKLTSKRGI
jgi:hypothetical protein